MYCFDEFVLAGREYTQKKKNKNVDNAVQTLDGAPFLWRWTPSPTDNRNIARRQSFSARRDGRTILYDCARRRVRTTVARRRFRRFSVSSCRLVVVSEERSSGFGDVHVFQGRAGKKNVVRSFLCGGAGRPWNEVERSVVHGPAASGPRVKTTIIMRAREACKWSDEIVYFFPPVHFSLNSKRLFHIVSFDAIANSDIGIAFRLVVVGHWRLNIP